MKLKTRLVLLLTIMLLASLAGIGVLQAIHRAEEAEALAYQRLQREGLLNQLIPLLEYPLDQFARDYSQWDEMAAFVAQPNPEWARINIDNSLTTFRLSAAWVLTPEGNVVHAAKEARLKTVPTFPESDAKVLRQLKRSPFLACYVRQGDTVYALRGCPIQPSADVQRNTRPLGWLVVLAHIDAEYLQRLGELNGAASVDLAASPDVSNQQSPTKIERELRDSSGKSVATFQLDYVPDDFPSESNFQEMILLTTLALVLIATVLIVLQLWVVRPFSLIAQCLVTGRPEVLKPLLSNRTELGHIARLVRIHFANQRAMSETMEARAQLARDLHDGVIQSIYAAGMGIAAAQTVLKTDPETAASQLHQIRTLLNDTIREARSFISGLDAGTTDGQPFANIVETLVESMSWIRKVRTEIAIDENAAQALSQQAREQTLQIVREALSNSLRHAHPSKVRIDLQQSPSGVAIAIVDDGTGFDPSVKRPGGHGLTNLVERASSVGARASIDSAPGRGTCVRIHFPATKPPQP